jgi:hypothetical protein
MKSRIHIWIVLIALLVMLPEAGELSAQCAMCKAVAENAQDEGGYGLATGLNNGILYLMGIPYLLLTVLFVVFFRKQIGGFMRSFNEIH